MSVETIPPASASARRPIIHEDTCTGCRKCLEACPTQAIQEPLNYCCSRCVKYCSVMDVPCRPESVVLCYHLCDGCGRCLEACPHGALHWSETLPDERGIVHVRRDRSPRRVGADEPLSAYSKE
jgi:NAD-dependent dihydropyrimidine dehydrogenase PreA subunit